MKMDMKIVLIALILYHSISLAGGPGSRGGAFLRLPKGARAIGMGEAHIACANDPSASFYNPASLIKINNSLLFMKSKYLVDIDYEYLGAIRRFSDASLGVGVIYLHTEDIRRDENRNEFGGFKNYDLCLNLGYSEALNQSLSFGMGIKNIISKLDDKKAVSIAFDLTFLYEKGPIALAAGIQNAGLGSNIEFIREPSPLPLQFVIGSSYLIKNLLISLDAIKPIEDAHYLNLGFEYSLKDTIFIRGGISKLNKGYFSGSYGFGFKLSRMRLDIAFSRSDLGNPSYFSLAFDY